MNDTQLNNLNTLRRNIRQLLDHRPPEHGQIWRNAWIFLKYILELNDSDIELIELHASHLSGPSPFSYWHISPSKNQLDDFAVHPEVMSYLYYTENIDDQYCISSPKINVLPTPYGIDFKGRIINGSIIRYQAMISNLVTMGIFDLLKKKAHSLICEIGSGFGGLAVHLSRILKKSTYVLVDLPETLFIAGAYIIVNDPEAKIYIFDPQNFSKEYIASNYQNYDYLLIPNTALHDLAGLNIDLFINMMSFQEMPEELISDYVRFAYDNCSGFMYSSNASKHPRNKQLISSVEEIVCKYFDVFPFPQVYDALHFNSDMNDQRVFIGRSKKLGGPTGNEVCSAGGHIKVLGGKTKICVGKSGQCPKIEHAGVVKRLMVRMRNTGVSSTLVSAYQYMLRRMFGR